MIIVLSGPGGAGKGTVSKELVARNPDIYLSKSWTTRPCRRDEDENAYFFTEQEVFEEKIKNGEMLEWINFEGYYYGTPKSELKADEDQKVLLEIDVEGAQNVKELYPEATILIFLEAPSSEIQKERLAQRGDSQEHIDMRIQRAKAEREHAKNLKAEWVINDDLPSTIKKIEDIISQK